MSDRKEEILDGLYDHTIDGEAEPVVVLTNEGLELGMEPKAILFDALIPALEEVGRLFEEGTYFVPEMMVAAKAMQGAMHILQPLIAASGFEPVGRFVMGTVKGDIHETSGSRWICAERQRVGTRPEGKNGHFSSRRRREKANEIRDDRED
ncbi:MAG: B12-binding domain-containing protein [Anaerolineales bacterium]